MTARAEEPPPWWIVIVCTDDYHQIYEQAITTRAKSRDEAEARATKIIGTDYLVIPMVFGPFSEEPNRAPII